MATYDEMFGKQGADRGPKRPPAPKWLNVGDTHTGVITGEPVRVPDFDFASKKDKYMVKTGGGKKGWEMKVDGAFDKELEHFALEQFAIPVKLTDGTDVTFYYNSNDQELKDAMADSGLPVAEGTTISKKFLRLDGRKKITKTKLAK
jgi:hypothetical protein